jgi:ParB family chromosome partitioning protein
MQVRIDEIVIRKRVRRNLGDIVPLMESMKKFGLMTPIIINKDNELIAGRRRLEAAKQLGWKTISATVVDKDDPLEKIEMEVEENVQRRNFTTDELADAYTRIDRLKNPGFFRRIWNAIARFFRKLFRRRRS